LLIVKSAKNTLLVNEFYPKKDLKLEDLNPEGIKKMELITWVVVYL
jgi:hypothetical protein